jgi:hypothetical protein
LAEHVALVCGLVDLVSERLETLVLDQGVLPGFDEERAGLDLPSWMPS